MSSKSSRVSDLSTACPIAYHSTEHYLQITSDGMEYHTFMKLTNGYIQKDNTGVIIPQMIYSLIDDPAANKWFAHSRLPPIHFTLDYSDKVGVRLSHLLKASAAQPLSSKSQPTVRAPSMPIAGVVICVSTYFE